MVLNAPPVTCRLFINVSDAEVKKSLDCVLSLLVNMSWLPYSLSLFFLHCLFIKCLVLDVSQSSSVAYLTTKRPLLNKP